MSGTDLLSRYPAVSLPSALVGLTSVFGMGTGVTPPEKAPNIFKPYLVGFPPLLLRRTRQRLSGGNFRVRNARPPLEEERV